MSNLRGDDLFGKYTDGNLNKKGLMKASKKERVEIIDANLEALVDYYFYEAVRGKERKWLPSIYELVGSEKCFMNPVMKILTSGSKKKKKLDLDAIPSGLHIIIMDAIDEVKRAYETKIRRYQSDNNNQRQAFNLDDLRDAADAQFSKLNSIVTLLVSKEIKKLVKWGIAEPYAVRLARCFVPKKYLNKHNVAKYFARLNKTLVEIQGMAVHNSEDDAFVNDAGINLGNDANIMSIYEHFLKKCDRDVYRAALLGALLERRTKAIDTYTKPQLSMYNTINRVITDLLEGKAVLNITGEKLKKKEIKEQLISKKELRKILRGYSERRAEDYRRGQDSSRRIIIGSLSEEEYPRLKEFFSSENQGLAKDILEGHYEPENQNDKNNNNQRNENRNRDNRNNDNRNNRDNNNRNKDRNRKNRDRD